MKALLIDSWLSSCGVISCHHRLCPLSSRVSSLHHDASFIKNVIVTFHFCFTLFIFKIWHNNPSFQNPLCLLLDLPATWSLVPTWSHMSDCVFTCDFSSGQPAPQVHIQGGCVWYTSVSWYNPQPLVFGLQGWEQSGRLGNNWWRSEWTNEKCTSLSSCYNLLFHLCSLFLLQVTKETAPNQVGRVRPCLKKTLDPGRVYSEEGHRASVSGSIRSRNSV